MVRSSCLLGLALALALLSARGGAAQSAEPAGRAVFVDRKPVAARLVGIDSEWNFKFEAGKKLTVVPAADLVYWGAYRDRETGPQVLLAAGGVLRADVLKLTADTVTIGDATGLGRGLWDESALPRSAVRGVLLQPPADALARDKLIDRMRGFDGPQDQLLLTSGETISGRLEEAPLGGRFLPADQPPKDAFKLTRADLPEPLSVAASKVVAVMLGGGGDARTDRLDRGAQLGFRDGSLINAAQVTSQGDTVELMLSGGGKLTAPLDQPDEAAPTLWRQITWARPISQRVEFLSDLEPIGYKHIPLLTLDWPFGNDQNVLGGRLRSGGALYGKGLGMHPVSRLAYDLDGRYRRFEAELALDDAAGRRGSVVFKVLVERQPNEWSTAYESPVVRGGDMPLPIAVDVKDARRIALIVDYADRADELDHANWLMARLIE